VIRPAAVTRVLGPIYTTVRDKYYVDEIVNATVIRLVMVFAVSWKWFDEHVVDGLVLGVGRANKLLAFFAAWFDKTFVDGAVNLVGLATQAFGAVARLFQTGRIQQYAAFAVAGGLLAAAWLILS
jgi:NADH-quinone oxidoreductase subunit L